MLRSEMKTLAKERLKGQWGNAVLIMILSGLLTGAAGLLGSLLGPFSVLVTLAVSGPLMLGSVYFYLKVSRNEKAEIGDLFWGFRNFAGAFVLTFLQSLFIFLWSLLFVIPGIMKAYSYSMAFYIMADEPEISARDAIRKSKEMMQGHRMELFVLQLSFFGWVLLGLVTCGLGNLYTLPYLNETMTFFYHNLAGGRTETETVREIRQGKLEDNSSAYSIPVYQAGGETEVLSSEPSNATTVLSQNTGEGTFTGLKGGLSGLCYVLEDGVEYSIGRDRASCGIVLDNGNASVSRLHCSVRYAAEENGYYVTDWSSNGTFADGVRLAQGQPQFVQRGTIITLGNQEEGFCLE